jgi:hypothetical protein
MAYCNKLAPKSGKMINSPYCTLSTGYDDKYTEESAHAKFLGLQIDNYLN